MTSKRRLYISLAALGGVLLVGGAIAVSYDKSIISSIFRLSAFRTVSTEVFTSPSNWKTCEEVPKVITLKNESTEPVAARIKYTEQWIASDGVTQLDLIDSSTNLRMAIVNLDNTDKWLLNDDGWYYYYRSLEPGETTASFMKSVTLNCDANLNGSEVDTCVSGSGGTVCSSNTSPYADATYTLRATLASIQASAVDEWAQEPVATTEATLLRGSYITSRIGNATKIVRETELPDNFPGEDDWRLSNDINSAGLRASTEDSEKPVYMWDASQYQSWGGEVDPDKYQAGTVYWYSEADTVYYNSDMEAFLTGWGGGTQLDDDSMSFYGSINASRVVDLDRAFTGLSLDGDFTWISSWDVSNVETMADAFNNSQLHDLTAFSGWRFKKLKDMSNAFALNPSLTSLNGAQNWFSEGSALENLQSAFVTNNALADISALANWDVSSVTNFTMMFMNDANIASVAELANWDLSSATTIQMMFSGCTAATGGDALETWSNTLDLDNVDISGAFSGLQTKPSWYTSY